MGRNPIETVMGAVVLLVAGLFLAFAYSTADLAPVEGYRLTATFNKVGGLAPGADVRIGGIKVGSVTAQRLDSETYQAVLDLSILPDVKLPADTTATIATDGLLGSKFLKLDPGTADEMLEPNAAITATMDYQSVEDLVGELIFLATQESQGGPGSQPLSELPGFE